MTQVQTKDVLKCITTVSGELCVMIDSLMHQRESSVTCSDAGMMLSPVYSFKLYLTENDASVYLSYQLN